MRTAKCPTCADNSWVPGRDCWNCRDTPIEGRQYVLDGDIDCFECEGDPHLFDAPMCQHPPFVEWDA